MARKLPRGAKPAKRKLTGGGYAEGYLDASGVFQAFEAVSGSYDGAAVVDHSVSYDSAAPASYDSPASAPSAPTTYESSSTTTSYDSTTY